MCEYYNLESREWERHSDDVFNAHFKHPIKILGVDAEYNVLRVCCTKHSTWAKRQGRANL